MTDPSGFHAHDPTLAPSGGGKSASADDHTLLRPADQMQAALAKLSARHREALEMKMLAGKSLQQLAQHFHMSETAAAQLLLEASQELAAHLAARQATQGE